MHTAPLVTVLMPAYNAASYIREAIDSVLGQTFTDFELLIINDGSTDDTLEIINSYNDDRIRVHTQDNQGVIGALNKGLALATCELIARFDADDVCYPNRLSEQYEFMKSNPDYVLIGSASDYIDKDGEPLFEWQPPAHKHEDVLKVVKRSCPFDHPSVMYRKSVALKLGGYPKGAIHYEDHIFWTLFVKEGKTLNFSHPLIKHRFNPESVTIDEKWRGDAFKEIKYRSIDRGYVTEEETKKLKEILATQDVSDYKKASYHSMLGKKFLWNKHEPVKARDHLRIAMKMMPGKPEPYFLYLISFLPSSWVKQLYNFAKSRGN